MKSDCGGLLGPPAGREGDGSSAASPARQTTGASAERNQSFSGTRHVSTR